MTTGFTGTQEVLLILGMMLVTYAARYPLLALAGRVTLPRLLELALSFVPVAVLTAICIPMVLRPGGGDWQVAWSNPYLLASVLAIGVAWFTRHLLLTITLGMLCFFLLRHYLPLLA